jgi:hypothetical protein
MARHFVSASTQYLEAAPAVTTVPFTMAAWLRSSSGATFQRPLALGTNGGSNEYYEFRLRGDVAGGLEFVATDPTNGAQVLSGTATYTAGVWFHYAAVVRSALDREAYKNGASFGTSTNFVAPTIANMTIGVLHAAGGYFNGLDGDMAEVGFWRVALTPAEIKRLAAGAACDQVRPASLVAYMPLDRDIIDRRRNVWTDNSGGAVSTFVPPRPRAREYDAQALAAAAGPQRVLPVVVKQAVQRAANW